MGEVGSYRCPSHPRCILAYDMYYFRAGSTLDSDSARHSKDLCPLHHPLFLEIKSIHWASAKFGHMIEAGFLLFPQGDMVNYDDIKRFIRQEIIKLFDGNWQPAGRRWVMLALPRHFFHPALPAVSLKLQCPPLPTHTHLQTAG